MSAPRRASTDSQAVPGGPEAAGRDGHGAMPAQRPKRGVEEIEKEMAERSERLAANIDELVGRFSPATLARQSVDRAGSMVRSPGGGVRVEVLGAVAGAALVAGLLVWRARRRR
ncbi:DUF3618 domain-containing protein [Actinobacteria bacterium YIM 96077]|uniref:DUF3618 domain-containing protein n=1 Tax=Phytoactinopolyspora halophila TaxID=1981511 RepID=A0A329R1T9_9ACTN|nr:DUF3618 domain-containing protein [Phytoactinopolyspora halophila]AYY12240.1 DUF3618 domain-containing protein [Actinobacteria bacterium YIM 96077]RAW18527.1 hypothetical protein DPM12_00035 [Phytoactinopolyspora halophila]